MDENIYKRVTTALSGLLDYDLAAESADTLLHEIDAIHYDSLTVMECVVTIEEEFSIAIDLMADDVNHTFQTLNNISTLVSHKLADKAALEADS
jgi:acyl carrier protein